MPKNNHFAQTNRLRHSFLCLSLLLSVVTLLVGFVTNAYGQVAIPLSELNSELPKDSDEMSLRIEAFGKQLFVRTKESVWKVDENGKASKLGNFQTNSEFVGFIRAVGDRLFVNTDKDLWVVNKDGGSERIVVNNEFVRSIEIDNETLFVGTIQGLWRVEKDSKPAKFDNIKGNVTEIKLFSEQLYFVEAETLFLLRISKDGKSDEIETILEKVDSIETFDEQLFVGTDKGLQVIGKDGEIKPIEITQSDLTKDRYKIKRFNNSLYIGSTTSGLWKLTKNGKLKQVSGVSGVIADVETNDEDLIVGTSKGLWVVNKSDEVLENKLPKIKEFVLSIKIVGKLIYIQTTKNLYRIDPNGKIKTELAPEGLWATAISYFLPSNWMPMEKVQVKAYYYDENGEASYDKTIPHELRFAKTPSDTEPSDNSFTSKDEKFRYEIGWGWQDVQYWVKDSWGNTFKTPKDNFYRGVPSQYFVAILPFVLSMVLVLGCFALAPKIGFCHSAIMNPWLRNYFSLGSVPLLVSVFPSLRRYILRRYSNSVGSDKKFTEWKTRFVSPNEYFLPEHFGKKLNDERRLLLTGQSGIGKTSFFKYLTAYYASKDKPSLPAKVFPVYISLTNYGGNSLEDFVYNQLFAYGKITDKELAPMFLEQGGLLIFLDGVNEVQNVSDRQKLSEFVEKFWTSNYICLSSQQSYPEIENIPKVELKTFSAEKVCEFIRNRVNDKEKAEKVIKSLTNEDYQLYSVPRDLEFAVAIINDGKDSLPKSRTELYKTVFSSIFANWKENGQVDAENILCEHAYTMIAERKLAFDSVDNPTFKEITTDLFEQKFLIKREKNYNFRHDLIRSYLASDYFYPRWQNLFAGLDKKIDSNWLEMLKFACENIEDSKEVKSLVYEVLEKSIRKDLVKDLVIWLKANHPSKCKSWEKDFYAKYGELDFK